MSTNYDAEHIKAVIVYRLMSEYVEMGFPSVPPLVLTALFVQCGIFGLCSTRTDNPFFFCLSLQQSVQRQMMNEKAAA